MMPFERIDAVRSDKHCDAALIHILALEYDGEKRTHWLLPLLIRIHECWCEFVEGEMCLVGIEEEIFFHFGDVFVLVVGISDESRQRDEGDNDMDRMDGTCRDGQARVSNDGFGSSSPSVTSHNSIA